MATSEGEERRGEGEVARERGEREGGLGTGATGNMVMLQSTEEALKGC